MIEFIEEGHIYLSDGIIIPSVSDFLKWLFPNKYKGISETILNNKAKFGTNVHLAIEMYERGLELPKMTYIEEACFNQYLKLKDKHNIKCLEQEQIVTDGTMAGRLDMIGEVQVIDSLLDIKTTSELDKDFLSWQLSTYEYLKGTPFTKLYCIWLPKKELGKLVEIERIPEERLLGKINEFLKEKRKEWNIF